MKIKISNLLGFLVWGSVVLSQDHWETAIYAGDNWNYRVPIEELPSGWNILNFDDSNWLNGPGGFGYSDDDDGKDSDPLAEFGTWRRTTGAEAEEDIDSSSEDEEESARMVDLPFGLCDD